MVEDEMTTAQAEDYVKSLGIAPTPEEKHNVYSFLHKVAIATDTTKIGNLSEEEVGNPDLTLRACKELELFCNEVGGMKSFGKIFKKKGEILSSTSLSKNAMLIKLAVVTRREQTNVLKAPPKENKGWFGKKKTSEGGLES